MRSATRRAGRVKRHLTEKRGDLRVSACGIVLLARDWRPARGAKTCQRCYAIWKEREE
jgi:hypothetical protein